MAAFSVMVYHLRGSLPVGLGQAGMELFFVLSGYLITGVVMSLTYESGRWMRFYSRRARRLFPALYAYILVGVAAAYLLQWPEPQHALAMGIASVFYVGNIWQLARPSADIAPFGGLWSLAVEEQFYILWPMAVWGVWRASSKVRSVALLAICCVAAAYLVRLVAYQHDWSTARTSYSLDTRAFGLGLGALARCVLPPHRLPRRTAQAIAIVAWIVAVAAVISVTEYTNAMFLGAWAIVAVAAAIAVGAAASDGSLGGALSSRPLSFLGRISYSLYLWHVLVIAVGMPHLHSVSPVVGQMILGGISLGVGWLSYRWIEQPFLRRGSRFVSRLHG